MSTTEEKQLYLCLRPFIGWPKNCWFVVRREPNLLNATTASDSDNQSQQGLLRLAAVPPPIDANNNYLSWTACASVGTKVYLIRCLDSTEVWVHDCRFQTWERGPSMATALINPVAKVAGGKIYVVDRDATATDPNWGGVFDPDVGHWEAIPSPFDHNNIEPGPRGLQCYVENDRFCIRIANGHYFGYSPETKMGYCFGYNPEGKTWEEIDSGSSISVYGGGSNIMGDGELYCQKSNRGISIFDNSQPGALVFDEREGHWRKLDGNGVMERMPKEIISARIVDVGGRMVMVWVQLRTNDQDDAADFCMWYTEIWCAEIEKKKNKDDWWREFHSLNKILLHSNWIVSKREVAEEQCSRLFKDCVFFSLPVRTGRLERRSRL